jgi:predicted HicB family RNase H-like nuclease
VLITGAPRWREGQIEGTIAVITDLTEHKKMEGELRRMNDLLQNQLDDLRELQGQLKNKPSATRSRNCTTAVT